MKMLRPFIQTLTVLTLVAGHASMVRAEFKNDIEADVVLGQSNLTNTSRDQAEFRPAANSLFGPSGLSVCGKF